MLIPTIMLISQWIVIGSIIYLIFAIKIERIWKLDALKWLYNILRK